MEEINITGIKIMGIKDIIRFQHCMILKMRITNNLTTTNPSELIFLKT